MDAGGAVNSRELVFHFDGLGRADVGAFAAADAFWRMDAGVGAESSARNGGGDLADDAASDVERCNRLLSLGHVKVGLAQRGIVAAHMQLCRRLRDQAARQRGRERRHILCREADQIGAEQVELVRRARCRDRTEMDGRALCGAVSLHADDGVADAQTGFEILVQVNEHIGKIACVRVFVVVFRLHGAGNDAEEIFRGVGHAHHAVALELAEINDGISLVKPRGVGELMRTDGVREAGDGLREILIELRTVFFAFVHSGHVVDVRQMRGRVKPAGTVAQNDAGSARGQHPHKLAQQRRMHRRGVLRRHGRDKIDLDGDAHTGLHPVQTAERCKHAFQCAAAGFRFIFITADDGNICIHSARLRFQHIFHIISQLRLDFKQKRVKIHSVYKLVNICYNKMSKQGLNVQKTRLFVMDQKKGAFLWTTETALTSKNWTVR